VATCLTSATRKRCRGAFTLRLVLPIILAATLAPPAGAQSASGEAKRPLSVIDTIALRNDTRVLAADSMGGRGTGSEGARRAATYIGQRLRGLGLSAVGSDYMHPVPLVRAYIGPGSRLVVRQNGDSSTFAAGSDFVIEPGAATAFRDVSGPALFAGVPANAAGSLRGADLRGALIVTAGTLDESADSLVRAWAIEGAVAVVQLVADSLVVAAIDETLGAERWWVDGVVDEPRWQAPVPRIVAGPRVAAAMLRGEPIPPIAFQGGPFNAVPLGRTISIDLDMEITPQPAANIVASIPGSDPALRDEIILYTAHYDHLGIDSREPGDSIFNGFSDNAAGVAMLLAIADVLRADPPPRSVVFLFPVAEERGLLGASWFAAEPPWPLERVRAVINLDGGAPPRPPVSWRIAGGLGTSIGARADSIAVSLGWVANLTGTRANSDHWPFLARGVPSIFIIPGNEWEATSAVQRDSLRLRWDHYHQPSDEWDAGFPFGGIARYAALALEIGRSVARHPPGRTR
jgi:hypothetical protein